MTTIDSDYDELYILRGQSDISSLKGLSLFKACVVTSPYGTILSCLDCSRILTTDYRLLMRHRRLFLLRLLLLLLLFCFLFKETPKQKIVLQGFHILVKFLGT
jgi:hypothetical protein